MAGSAAMHQQGLRSFTLGCLDFNLGDDFALKIVGRFSLGRGRQAITGCEGVNSPTNAVSCPLPQSIHS